MSIEYIEGFHQRVVLTLGLVICTLAGSGCTSLDLGSTHHRTFPNGVASSTERYIRPNDVLKEAIIRKGDSITIAVQSVYLKDFWEANKLRQFFSIGDDSKRGEIAIVASFGPMQRNKVVQATADGARSGRILYYAEHVKTQTSLPFFGLPVYGPITYDGLPLSLSFHIVELDQREDARAKAVVQTLAKLGSASYPPSSPILAALEQVGNSLLSQNGDDLIFTYAGVLYPLGKESLLRQSYLTSGYLVLIRPEASSKPAEEGFPIDWSKLTLDQTTGMLTAGGKAFTEASYVVLWIDKGLPPVELDAAESLASFTERLTAGDSSPAAIIEAGNTLVGTLRRDQNRNEALRMVASIRNAKDKEIPVPASSVGRLEELFATIDLLRDEDKREILASVRDLSGNPNLQPAEFKTLLK